MPTLRLEQALRNAWHRSYTPLLDTAKKAERTPHVNRSLSGADTVNIRIVIELLDRVIIELLGCACSSTLYLSTQGQRRSSRTLKSSCENEDD